MFAGIFSEGSYFYYVVVSLCYSTGTKVQLLQLGHRYFVYFLDRNNVIVFLVYTQLHKLRCFNLLKLTSIKQPKTSGNLLLSTIG